MEMSNHRPCMAAENELHCVLGKLTDGVVHPADTGFDGDDDG